MMSSFHLVSDPFTDKLNYMSNCIRYPGSERVLQCLFGIPKYFLLGPQERDYIRLPPELTRLVPTLAVTTTRKRNVNLVISCPLPNAFRLKLEIYLYLEEKGLN